MMTGIAAALAEAWQSGTPVAPLGPLDMLADAATAEEVAGDVLLKLDLMPCGIRVTESGLLGAMLSGRIMRDGVRLPMAAMPHGRAAPALLAVLAEALAEDGTAAPVFSALHPALDIASSRWRDGPANALEATADLAGLGYVLIGRGKPATTMPDACVLAEGARRPRAKPADAMALLLRAAQVAREAGGLPAGALLVVVMDGRAQPVVPGTHWTASWKGLGSAKVAISAE